MSDLFSGLPDLILEEIAKQLVPPNSTAWKQLSSDVFPLRLLTSRFNHELTSALLRNVTLRLHPLELDDPKAFLTFRRKVPNDVYPSKLLELSRHSLPSRVDMNCKCAPARFQFCSAHDSERQNATAVTKFLGQAINVCRSGLEELHISIHTPNREEDVYHDVEVRNTFFPLINLKEATFLGERFHPILQTVTAAAGQLAALHLDSMNAPRYRYNKRPIPAITICPDVLGTNNLVWLTDEIKANRIAFQPRQIMVNLDVHELQSFEGIISAWTYLATTAFGKRLDRVAVTSAVGIKGTDRERIEEAVRKARDGAMVAIEWLA